MSHNFVKDIAEMHHKFAVNPAIRALPQELLSKFLTFRINFLQEEIDELKNATNPDDIVDALIDLCVVAIGTLDAYEVDTVLAWDRVLEKNMQKDPGVNPNRPNPFGLPDMVKPAGWTPPSHADNIGLLKEIYGDE